MLGPSPPLKSKAPAFWRQSCACGSIWGRGAENAGEKGRCLFAGDYRVPRLDTYCCGVLEPRQVFLLAAKYSTTVHI